ncbi:MAG: DUF6273 domain-containing protein, partial [Solobacterium sp.]|nr:DUF6273 domain-containing protein [Solobacterium sp.]
MKKFLMIFIPVFIAADLLLLLLLFVIMPQQDYAKAMKLLNEGDYGTAYAILEKRGKKEQVIEDKYDRIVTGRDAGAIGSDERYTMAVYFMDSGRYDEAIRLLKDLDYRDSEDLLESCYTAKYGSDYQKGSIYETGSVLKMGTFEQDNDESDGTEPIEWIVLANEEDSLLIISKYGLECRKFDDFHSNVTWDTCSLRKWLNDEFLHGSFDAAEQERILETALEKAGNPQSDALDGEDTADRVFLLSFADADTYFISDDARICELTEYAKANSKYAEASGMTCSWWLRAPGFDNTLTATIGRKGNIRYTGEVSDS